MDPLWNYVSEFQCTQMTLASAIDITSLLESRRQDTVDAVTHTLKEHGDVIPYYEIGRDVRTPPAGFLGEDIATIT